MSQWGVMTWDANGNPNNNGMVTTSVLSYAALGSGALSGSWTLNVPSSYSLKFIFLLNGNEDASGNMRQITVSGNTVTMSSAAANAVGDNIFPPGAGWLIFYVV